MKRSKKYFIFSSAFYLIMRLMKSPKYFEKIAILKIWQLVFFWGVKTYFGIGYMTFNMKDLQYEVIHLSLLFLLTSNLISWLFLHQFLGTKNTEANKSLKTDANGAYW